MKCQVVVVLEILKKSRKARGTECLCADNQTNHEEMELGDLLIIPSMDMPGGGVKALIESSAIEVAGYC